jgi:hypothetical protein
MNFFGSMLTSTFIRWRLGINKLKNIDYLR